MEWSGVEKASSGSCSRPRSSSPASRHGSVNVLATLRRGFKRGYLANCRPSCGRTGERQREGRETQTPALPRSSSR